jgi:hypothetical protein
VKGVVLYFISWVGKLEKVLLSVVELRLWSDLMFMLEFGQSGYESICCSVST